MNKRKIIGNIGVLAICIAILVLFFVAPFVNIMTNALAESGGTPEINEAKTFFDFVRFFNAVDYYDIGGNTDIWFVAEGPLWLGVATTIFYLLAFVGVVWLTITSLISVIGIFTKKDLISSSKTIKPLGVATSLVGLFVFAACFICHKILNSMSYGYMELHILYGQYIIGALFFLLFIFSIVSKDKRPVTVSSTSKPVRYAIPFTISIVSLVLLALPMLSVETLALADDEIYFSSIRYFYNVYNILGNSPDMFKKIITLVLLVSLILTAINLLFVALFSFLTICSSSQGKRSDKLVCATKVFSTFALLTSIVVFIALSSFSCLFFGGIFRLTDTTNIASVSLLTNYTYAFLGLSFALYASTCLIPGIAKVKITKKIELNVSPAEQIKKNGNLSQPAQKTSPIAQQQAVAQNTSPTENNNEDVSHQTQPITPIQAIQKAPANSEHSIQNNSQPVQQTASNNNTQPAQNAQNVQQNPQQVFVKPAVAPAQNPKIADGNPPTNPPTNTGV